MRDDDEEALRRGLAERGGLMPMLPWFPNLYWSRDAGFLTRLELITAGRMERRRRGGIGGDECDCYWCERDRHDWGE